METLIAITASVRSSVKVTIYSFHLSFPVFESIYSQTFCVLTTTLEANCVVVNVNYRHAPEDPYPAAVDDAVEALKWVFSSGPSTLNINSQRIGLGGTSAGGNLAAILSLKATLCTPPIPIQFQLLVLPVIDNTATVAEGQGVWAQNQHSPWLTPGKMTWYRNMYLPNAKDALGWDVSPQLAPKDLLAKSPKTWIAGSELDILGPEAVKYGEQLKGLGVDVTVQVLKGCTHSALALSGMLSRPLISFVDTFCADEETG